MDILINPLITLPTLKKSVGEYFTQPKNKYHLRISHYHRLINQILPSVFFCPNLKKKMLLFIISVRRLNLHFFFNLFIFIYFICFYISSFIWVKYFAIAKCFFLKLSSKILVTLKGVRRLIVNIIHKSPQRTSLTNMKKKNSILTSQERRGETQLRPLLSTHIIF